MLPEGSRGSELRNFRLCGGVLSTNETQSFKIQEDHVTPPGTTGEAFQNAECLIKTQRMSKLRPDGKKEGRVQIKGSPGAGSVGEMRRRAGISKN